MRKEALPPRRPSFAILAAFLPCLLEPQSSQRWGLRVEAIVGTSSFFLDEFFEDPPKNIYIKVIDMQMYVECRNM